MSESHKSWYEEAACGPENLERIGQRYNPPIEANEFTSGDTFAWTRAKEICNFCGVQVQCLQTELTDVKNGLDFSGLRAGYTPKEIKRAIKDQDYADKMIIEALRKQRVIIEFGLTREKVTN